MVEVIRHSRVGLGGDEGGVLAAQLLGRPAVREVVHHEPGDADARQPLQVGRLTFRTTGRRTPR